MPCKATVEHVRKACCSPYIPSRCPPHVYKCTVCSTVSTACYVLQVLSRSTSGAGLAARGVGSPTVGDGPGYRQLWAQVRHRANGGKVPCVWVSRAKQSRAASFWWARQLAGQCCIEDSHFGSTLVRSLLAGGWHAGRQLYHWILPSFSVLSAFTRFCPLLAGHGHAGGRRAGGGGGDDRGGPAAGREAAAARCRGCPGASLVQTSGCSWAEVISTTILGWGFLVLTSSLAAALAALCWRR